VFFMNRSRKVRIAFRVFDVLIAILLACGAYSIYRSWEDRKGLIEACEVLNGTYIESNGKARCLKAENLFVSGAHR